jgi:hypothetical protein
MTDSIKREIERLLDEPGRPPATSQGSDRLRSRLTATLSEGLDDASVTSSEFGVQDIASIAAFIDGQLTGAARDKFTADLAQQQGLRADVESTAALVYSTSDSPLEVPRHLLARAGAQFASAQPPPQAAARWDFSALLTAFLPRQRIAWAMVAALALIVAVPAGLMINGQSGGPQPELSGVPEPVDAVSQQEKDKACEEKLKEMQKAGKSKPALPDRPPSSASTPKDPCDRPTPQRDGSTNK